MNWRECAGRINYEYIVKAAFIVAASFICFILIRYGNYYPWSDEWHLIPLITGTASLNLEELFRPHGEHVIPLLKAAYFIVSKFSLGDFRIHILVNAIILSLACYTILRSIVSIRGTARLSDMFLIFSLLHLSHGVYFWGFHFQFISSTTILLLIFAIFTQQGFKNTPWTLYKAIAMGVLILLLPLCGVNGLVPAFLISVYLVVISLRVIRQKNYAPGLIMLLLSGASLCIGALILFKFSLRGSPSPFTSHTPYEFFVTSANVFTSPLGAKFGARIDAKILLLFFIASGLMAIMPTRFLRILGLRNFFVSDMGELRIHYLVFTISILLLVASIGYGRGSRGWEQGLEMHYSLLAVPLFICQYFAFELYRHRVVKIFLQGLMAVAFGIVFFTSLPVALDMGKCTEKRLLAVDRDLLGGMTLHQMSIVHTSDLFYVDQSDTREAVEKGLSLLKEANIGRFGYSQSGIPAVNTGEKKEHP
ncbi:MAG: hypothetical protein A2Y97_05790 [Nitrospirae bacterium RBG_13_39_12]|nr:MAG: hypothetical protein A2Y97_05790 [Nitrospirae bacterium RBG_13_39_12]